MYTISSTPGDRLDTAATIPDALAALASQLTDQLLNGQVWWKITDPAGTEHRGTNALNGRLDLLTIAIDELVEDLYNQLHRSADGGPHAARGQPFPASGCRVDVFGINERRSAARHARRHLECAGEFGTHPQGRGQHTNGLLRQYFPKSTDLTVRTPEDLPRWPPR